jgi:hypothetical protein
MFVILVLYIDSAMYLIPHESKETNDKSFLNNTIKLNKFNLIDEDEDI